MKLYIHIGTEKTGSSFLQTYLARNRSLLKNHRICYPSAGIQEANALKGIITPGNASDLEKLLAVEAWGKVKAWLADKKKEAENQNCSIILLSNEILLTRFSKKGILAKFVEILETFQIECKGLLLMIREPVSQALSLYKHRSKEGVFYPIEDWLRNRYILNEALSDFYKVLENTKLNVSQYPYQKDSQYLVDVCINKWLKLDEDVMVPHTSVNPSLSLSELVLLCEIFKKDEILAKRYYDFMIKLNPKEKSDDTFYKTYIKNHINNFMVAYNELWVEVNNHMSTPTEIYNYNELPVDDTQKITSFSPIQMEEIASFIAYSNSFQYKVYRTIKKTKRTILKFTPKTVIEWRKKILYS